VSGSPRQLVGLVLGFCLAGAVLGEPQGKGVLEVTTEPTGAAVSLGPLAFSASPARFENLDAGRYKVTVTCSGYAATSFVVAMKSSGRVSTNIVLTPLADWIDAEARPQASVEHDGEVETYAALAEAVAAAPSGAVITLSPGVYRGGVVLERPVRLSPEREGVIIEADGAPCLKVVGEDVVLSGLTLRQRGMTASYALEISGCSPRVDGCTITADHASGVGIHGVHAAPVLSGVEIHTPRGAGVVVYDQAGGSLDVKIEGAGLSGIEAHGASGLEIEAEVTGAGEAGLLLDGGTNVTVRNCVVSQCGGAGIEYRGGVAVDLGSCRLKENEGGGLLVHGQAGGRVRDCTMERNTLAGVEMRDRASLVLTGCRILRGLESGVLFHRGAAGLLRSCRVEGQFGAGIEVRDGGRLHVVSCILAKGGRAGLVVRDRAVVVMGKSRVVNNASNGIEVQRGGRLELVSSSSSSNRYYGVMVAGGGVASVRDVRLDGNLRGMRRVEEGGGWSW
jgi:hypothetical protein